MEKKESIKEYLQKMLDRWNKYDELDGFVAENFRVDLEKTLEYWDLRIADNKEELDKAREEGKGRKLQGWECPKCGSVYSPLTFECPTCKNSGIKVRTSDRTSGYDNTSYLN